MDAPKPAMTTSSQPQAVQMSALLCAVFTYAEERTLTHILPRRDEPARPRQ